MTALAVLIGGFNGKGVRPFAAAAYLRGRARAAFDSQGWSKGIPWLPKRVPSVPGIVSDLMAGRDVHPSRFADAALVATGQLRDTIRAEVLGDSVMMEAPVDYASEMQNGGTTSQPVDKSIVQPLKDFLKEHPELRGKLGFLFGLAKKEQPLVTKVPPRNFLVPSEEELATAHALGGLAGVR